MADPGASNAPQAVSKFPDPPRALYAVLTSEGAEPAAPPKPPGEEESFNMFGRTYSTSDRLPSLLESGRACLYDETKPVSEELRRLNRTLLTLFSSLVATLSTAGGEPGDIVGRIEDVFINMHHLLNVMRPAQAIQDIRRLLHRQAESRRQVARDLNLAMKRAERAIAEAAADLRDSLPEPNVLEAEQNALLIVKEQMAKSLPQIRKSDKLGWYRGSETTSNLTCSETTTKSRAVPQHQGPQVIEIDSSILTEFTRITNE